MSTTREIELEKELRAQRDRADLLSAWLARYVVDYNIEHLDGCPEDDTCRCPHVAYINKILEGSQIVEARDDPSYLRGELALAERDRRAAVDQKRQSEMRRIALESAVHRHLDANLMEDEVEIIARAGRELAAQKAQVGNLTEEVARLHGELDRAEKVMRDMNDNARGVLDAMRERLTRSAP